MRWTGRNLMSLGLMVITAWVVIAATKWPFSTALFPVIIGALVFFLATADFLLGWFEKGKTVEKPSGGERHSPEAAVEPLMGEVLLAFSWAVGFLLLILLLGFPIAVPLFVFVFLKFHGREGWRMSLGLTALAFAAFYGLFVRVCDIPFLEGWIQNGLRALGIG